MLMAACDVHRYEQLGVFSACPQDMTPVNDMKSADVHVGIS